MLSLSGVLASEPAHMRAVARQVQATLHPLEWYAATHSRSHKSTNSSLIKWDVKIEVYALFLGLSQCYYKALVNKTTVALISSPQIVYTNKLQTIN